MLTFSMILLQKKKSFSMLYILEIISSIITVPSSCKFIVSLNILLWTECWSLCVSVFLSLALSQDPGGWRVYQVITSTQPLAVYRWQM